MSRNRNSPGFLRAGWTLRICLGIALLMTNTSGYALQHLLNRPAPPFSRTGLDHAPVTLSAFRGKVVLLNFWATWCAPCLHEIPQFMEWQKQYGPRGLVVLGVSIDDDQAPVRRCVQKLGVNYPIVMGDARLGESYGGVFGVPVTFLIDRRGIVRARINGGSSLHGMEEQLRRLLAEPR